MSIEAAALAAVTVHHADQKPWELAQLGHIILSVYHGCPRLVEVGTFRGGTAWFFAEIGCYVTTVDINPARRDTTHEFVQYLAGDSAEVLAQMSAQGFDVAFIDGAHSYRGVSADWAAAQRVVRPGGLIAFHDIVQHAPGSGCEVHQLWWEIKEGWPTIEIVDPAFTASQVPWAGIGVVRV